MNPRWPVFIPTKGRSENRFSIQMFDEIGVPYRIVVEPQEVDSYARYIDVSRILVLPHRDQGLVATRNWIWDRALEEGHRYFWTFDDNIRGLFRLNRNLKTPCSDGTIMRVIEDFALRYENLPISGMNYFMFALRKNRMPPVYINSRVYSNMLIETDFRDPWGQPYRNDRNLKYNDDTDLNLQVMKDGFCTVLFNAFLIYKLNTMAVKGGMDYGERKARWSEKEQDDRYRATKQLQDKHPDVTRITRKWGRWHHHVDYSRFRANKLILREGVAIPDEDDDYGMVMEQKIDGHWRRVQSFHAGFVRALDDK